MKIRKEISGVHMFERSIGMHLLLDEIDVPLDEICCSPRTFSIALTNICDLKCHFCYAPKNRHTLDIEYLKSVLLKADELGVLEITLGGGEPLLYPYLVEIINWIYDETSMGVSLTTHGHHITKELIQHIKGKLSKIRISIDDIEPRYSQIRGKPLSQLVDKIKNHVKGNLHFGVNIVTNPEHLKNLPRLLDFIILTGAEDVLIIPEHSMGTLYFVESDWNLLEEIIFDYQNKIQINITSNAITHLNINTLEAANKDEYLYAHLSADGQIKENSYINIGLPLLDHENLKNIFLTLKQNKI